MKNITYILLTCIVLVIWYLQQKHVEKTVQTKQISIIAKKEPPKKISKSKFSSVITEISPVRLPTIKTTLDTLKNEESISRIKKKTEKTNPKKNIFDEEKDTTPPPSKSQEELDDEAEDEHTDIIILEEDSTEIEKPANELEDEAVTIEEEIPEEGEAPTKSTEELQDEQQL